MYKEETDSGGFRCWLQAEEQEQLLDYYDDYERELAIKLMLQSGLRADEVPRVTANSIQDSDADFKILQVPKAKRGYRETFIPSDLATEILSIYKVKDDVNKDDPIIDKTERTIQNWVYDASEALAEETGNEDWLDVSAHDCRRTWATKMIQSGITGDVVMDWGGWSDYQTFRDHYWRRDDEQIQSNLEDAGLV
jgi:integrase